jgi:hypothetical protein
MMYRAVGKENQQLPRDMREEFRAVERSTQQANRHHPVVIRETTEHSR